MQIMIRKMCLGQIVPVMAFLSGNVNSNRDQDERRALTPLKQMAERTGAAVVLVRHLNKTPGGNPLYRGGGSIGIIGAARSGMVVGKHPDDEETRVLAGQKNNLSLPPVSLAYGIETAENGAARIVYKGASKATVGQLLKVPADEGEKSALSEAKDFLLDELRDGPMGAKQVRRSVHEGDISERTLNRAKQMLGIKSEKESDGSWTWILPSKGGEEGQGPTAGPLGTVGTLGKDANVKQFESAYLKQEGQGCQEGQADHHPTCIHGYPDGTGCYLCDPSHPYRPGRAERGKREGVTQHGDTL